MMIPAGENWLNTDFMKGLWIEAGKESWMLVFWADQPPAPFEDLKSESFTLFEGQASEIERMMRRRDSPKIRIAELEADKKFFMERIAELEKKLSQLGLKV